MVAIKSLFITNKSNFALILILCVFALIFSLISIPNHQLFRTHALDLGMMNKTLYDLSHFNKSYFTLSADGSIVNYFGDHFSPIMYLYIPFYYLFGSYTLLIIQLISILLGGLGIYKIALLILKNEAYSLLILIHFFCIWGICSALSFDFHNNVIGAMLVPWLIYHYLKSNKKIVLLYTILILICKENMAIWIVFIFLSLTMLNWSKFNFKQFLKFEFPIIVFSFLYFILVSGVIMPYLNDGNGVNQLARYHEYGDSISGIIWNFISHPSKIFQMLFTNTSGDAIADGIKQELHFMFLISGGLFIFSKPALFIMLIPIYLQKLMSDNFCIWGITGQYSIELVPIISLGLIYMIVFVKKKQFAYPILLLTLFLTLYYTIEKIEKRKSEWYENTNSIFYKSKHYETNFNITEINEGLLHVPQDESISSCSELSPHLAFRQKIYLFPTIKDAKYIVL